jgi:hypothetical protein
MLPWHKTKPGRKLTTGSKDGRIRHTGCERSGCDDPNTRDRLEPLAGDALPVPGHQLPFDGADLGSQTEKLSP